MGDGETIMLPQMRRIMSRLAIIRNYHDMKRTHTEITKVGDTSFMIMLRRIIRGQQQMKGCVGYNLGVLVFENIRNIEYIISDGIDNVQEKNGMLDKISAAVYFLKHGLLSHMECDSDFTHCSKHGLIG